MPGVAGAEERLDDLANGPAAAGEATDPVGRLPDLGHGVGWRDRESRAAEEREIGELLPYVRKARYVGRYGWVTATVTDEETLEAALEWLLESYWLKAPAELRAAVEQL